MVGGGGRVCAAPHSYMSLFSKTHTQAELLFSVSAWSLQCGQRVMNTMEREKQRRGARGSGDGGECVGEQIGLEMRGRGGGGGAG